MTRRPAGPRALPVASLSASGTVVAPRRRRRRRASDSDSDSESPATRTRARLRLGLGVGGVGRASAAGSGCAVPVTVSPSRPPAVPLAVTVSLPVALAPGHCHCQWYRSVAFRRRRSCSLRVRLSTVSGSIVTQARSRCSPPGLSGRSQFMHQAFKIKTQRLLPEVPVGI